MQKVENGKFVSVSYTGTLENGEVFDTSEGRRPLEFQTGAGQLIKGFEDAVIGMSLNEKNPVTGPATFFPKSATPRPKGNMRS